MGRLGVTRLATRSDLREVFGLTFLTETKSWAKEAHDHYRSRANSLAERTEAEETKRRPSILSRISNLRPILIQAGVLTEADREAFALLCRTFDEIERLDMVLASEGEYQTAKNGFKAPHPALHQRQKWIDTRRRLLAEFGLTPSARGSVTIAKPRLGIIPRRRKAGE